MEGRISSSSNPLKLKKNKVDGWIYLGAQFYTRRRPVCQKCVSRSTGLYIIKSRFHDTHGPVKEEEEEKGASNMFPFSAFFFLSDTTTTYKKTKQEKKRTTTTIKVKMVDLLNKKKKWNNNNSSSSPL
jgi:hypothetical protein